MRGRGGDGRRGSRKKSVRKQAQNQQHTVAGKLRLEKKKWETLEERKKNWGKNCGESKSGRLFFPCHKQVFHPALPPPPSPSAIPPTPPHSGKWRRNRCFCPLYKEFSLVRERGWSWRKGKEGGKNHFFFYWSSFQRKGRRRALTFCSGFSASSSFSPASTTISHSFPSFLPFFLPSFLPSPIVVVHNGRFWEAAFCYCQLFLRGRQADAEWRRKRKKRRKEKKNLFSLLLPLSL